MAFHELTRKLKGSDTDPSGDAVQQLVQSMQKFAAEHLVSLESTKGEHSELDKNSEVVLGQTVLPERSNQLLFIHHVNRLLDFLEDVLPKDVLAARKHFKPPIEIPSRQELCEDPRKIAQVLRRFELLTEQRNVYKEDKVALGQVGVFLPFILEFVSRGLVGKLPDLPAPDYEVIHHAIDDCIQVVEQQKKSIHRMFGTIKIPEILEELPDEFASIEGREFYSYKQAETLNPWIKKSLLFGSKLAFTAPGVIAVATWAAVTAAAVGSFVFCRECIWATGRGAANSKKWLEVKWDEFQVYADEQAPILKPVVKSLQLAAVVAGVVIVAPFALGWAGLKGSFSWARSTANAVGGFLRDCAAATISGIAAVCHCTKVATIATVGVIAYGVSWSFGRARDGISWCIRATKSGLAKLEPWKWPFLRRYESRIKALLSNETQWFNLSNLKRYFPGRRLNKNTPLTTNDSRDPLFEKRLSVLEVLTPINRKGDLKPIAPLLSFKLRKNPDLLRKIVPTYKFDSPMEEDHPSTNETIIRLPVGSRFVTLPLPASYEITGLKLLDENENVIPELPPIESCYLGGARLSVPKQTREVVYRVKASDTSFTETELTEIVKAFGLRTVHLGIEGEAIWQAIEEFDLDPENRADLLYAYQSERGFVFSNDNFAHNLLRYAGNSLAEMIGGLRIGTYDPLAYYLCAMFQQHRLPGTIATGLVPIAGTFDNGPYSVAVGRSLSTVSVLTENGHRNFDLAGNAESAEDLSDDVTPMAALEIISKLRNLSNRELFQFGEEVHEILTSNNKSVLAAISDKLSKAVRRVKQLFTGDSDVEMYDLSRNQEGKGKLNYVPNGTVVKALGVKIAVERYIEQAHQTGDVESLFKYVFKNHRIDKPKVEELEQLKGTEHEGLHLYSPMQRLHEFCVEALESDAYSKAMRRKLFSFICLRLPDHKAVEDLACGVGNRAEFYSEKSNDLRALSLEEAYQLITNENLELLIDVTRYNYVLGYLGLAFTDYGSKQCSEFIQEQKAEDVRKYCDQLYNLVVKQFHQENNDPDKFKRAAKLGPINDLVVLLANNIILARNSLDDGDAGVAELDAAVGKLTKLLRLNCSASYGKGFDLFIRAYLRDGIGVDGFSTAYKTVLREVGFKALVPSLEDKALEKFGRALNTAINIGRTSPNSLELCFEAVQREAPGALARIRSNGLLRDIEREFRSLQRWDKNCMNYPCVENPASYILYKMALTDTGRAYKNAAILEKWGVVTNQEIRERAPKQYERRIARRLVGMLQVDIRGSLVIDIKEGTSRAETLFASRIPALYEDLTRVDKRWKAICKFVELRRDSTHWADKAIREFRLQFPDLAGKFDMSTHDPYLQQLVLDSFENLLNEVPAKDIYQGLVWQAVESTKPEYANNHRAVRKFLETAKLEEGETFDDFCKRLNDATNFTDPEDSSTSLADINPSSLAPVALFCSALRDVEVSNWEQSDYPELEEKLGGGVNNLAFSYATYSTNIPSYLRTAARNSYSNSSVPIGDVWRECFRNATDYTLSLDKLIEHIEVRALRLSFKMNDAWPQYLFSRTGKVVVRSRSGDFLELKEFGAGDEYKQIDWRASARSSKLYVRRNQEDEERNITLVYDLQLIAQEAHYWTQALSEHSHGRVTDEVLESRRPSELVSLLTLLELAALEDRNVSLLLYGRSLHRYIPNLVKTTGRGRSSYDSKAFLEVLSNELRGPAQVFEFERANFSDFPATNIFECADLPNMADRVVLFALSKKNASKSLGLYRVLQKQGRLVAQLKVTDQTQSKEETAEGDEDGS